MGSGVPGGMLPNSTLAAWVTAETGLWSAKTRSGAGKPSVGVKVLARKLSGKMTMNEALLTTSGALAVSPTNAMIHEIA